MRKPSSDPSVHEEPHLRGKGYRADRTEARAARTLNRAAQRGQSEDEKVEHTVWDEPGLSPQLAGPTPEGELTYDRWLQGRREQVGVGRTWAVAGLVALLAGPWAILGAFWGSGQTKFSILAIVVFAPVVEEVMKTAAALYVVEKRPFLFRSPFQIAICVLVGAFVFSATENILYLKVYIPDASSILIRWRWTVCLAMHMGCSLIVGLGIMRIWRDVWQRRARPRLTLGFPYVLTAVILHGAYNAFAVILSLAGLRF